MLCTPDQSCNDCIALMKLNDDTQQSGAQVVMSVFNTLLWSLLVLFPFVQVHRCMCVCACTCVNLYTILCVYSCYSYIIMCRHQAARVTSHCSKLLKSAPTIRARSLLYQESTTAELDSFIVYTSAIKMRVSIT